MQPRDAHAALYRLALAGTAPAEALPQALRHRLVTYLWEQGWTDLQIAVHTRQTLYTTARIRSAMWLTPNRHTVIHEVA